MPAMARGLAKPFHRETVGAIVGSAGRPLYRLGLSAWLSTYMTCVPPTPAGSYRPAFLKPRSFSSVMRSSASSFMSSFEPKLMEPVGQTLTQAGSRPTATRSEHSVHL